MKKLKAFIAEDETHNRELLETMLAENCRDRIEVLGTSGSIIDAIEQLRYLKVDILFLDIELSDGNVFELLREIDYKNYKIIFTTGYAQHAIKAIKFGAMDYLLKPLILAELKEAVNKATHTPADTNPILDDYISRKAFSLSDYLLVHSQTSIEKIAMEHISHFAADGIYTVIYHEGKKTVSSKHIGLYEDVLPPAIFHRCHKSYIVNKYHIKRVGKGRSLSLTLFSNTELPVAVRKKEEFMQWYRE